MVNFSNKSVYKTGKNTLRKPKVWVVSGGTWALIIICWEYNKWDYIKRPLSTAPEPREQESQVPEEQEGSMGT